MKIVDHETFLTLSTGRTNKDSHVSPATRAD